MDRIAVFVDDAEYAMHLLAPMVAQGAGDTEWLVVTCAPRLTHRIGKWVAHSSREQWRARWTARLRERLDPMFEAHPGCAVRWMQARRPLPEVTRDLRTRLGAGLAVLDARRPKIGQPLMPIDASQAPPSAWKQPVAVSGSLSIMLALTD